MIPIIVVPTCKATTSKDGITGGGGGVNARCSMLDMYKGLFLPNFVELSNWTNLKVE